jgi:hypothetical protein
VDGDGQILIQEDPGNSSYIAKTWKVNPANPLAAVQILESDRARFLPPTAAPYNQDEESSGIIEVTDIVQYANVTSWPTCRRISTCRRPTRNWCRTGSCIS